MPYVITYSQKWHPERFGTAEVATAREALAAILDLELSDEDVRSVRVPDGREFEVFRNAVRLEALRRELKWAVKQERNT